MSHLADFMADTAAISRATALVEFETDPQTPGRTAYRITGPSADVVQNAIDARMRHAEDRPGRNFARFTAPTRTADGWQALGEVVLEVVSPSIVPELA